jgi:ubiquinone/menaquinone biosynthesis C-methylase UbiE
MRQREKVVPLARGRVLEVGIGSGLNLPFYDSAKVTRVWGLEPSREMIRMAEGAARRAPFAVEFLQASASAIPLDGKTVDTVLTTYTLCTVPEAELALLEMSRVLRPGGQLVFCEHGVAPDVSVRLWQDRLTPVWNRLAGGCELNRVIPAIIEAGGFRIKAMDAMYLPGWRPATFNYWGTATPK